MKAQLNLDQIRMAWNYACLRDNTNSLTIRQDFLGAEIHFDDYDCDKEFGWCVEYVIPPHRLAVLDVNIEDAFCEENIRVLNIRNYGSNNGHRPGCYNAYYHNEGDHIKRQYAYQTSVISQEGIDALKKKFNLSDEFIVSYFGK